MEAELKQILKLEGLDKVKALAAYMGDVNKSLAERTAAEKQLVKALDQTATAQQLVNGEFKNEQKAIAQLRNERSVAHKEMKSQKEEERDIYFRIGMELRTMMRASAQEGRVAREAFGSLGGYLGEGFANQLNTAFLKFDELKFAFEASAIAGENMKGKLGGILTTIGSFGLPIAALATGITLVMENFKKLQEAADQAREAMRKVFADTAAEYFNLTKAQQMAMRAGEREKAEKDVRDLTALRIRLNESVSGTPQEKMLKEMALIKIDEQVAERQAQIRQLDVAIKKLSEEIREAKKEAAKKAGPTGPGFAAPAAPDATVMSEEEWFWATHQYTPSDFFHQRVVKGQVTPLTWDQLQEPYRGASKLPGLGTGMSAIKAGPFQMPELTGVDLKPESWSMANPIKEDFSKLTGEAKQFSDTMKVMMGQIAGTITSQLGGAFRKVFGEGENLAADLLTTIFTTFINFGLGSSFRGMGFMAGGGVITEPYIARGLHSGRMLALGEKGPELVTPMNRVTSSYLPRSNSDSSAVMNSVQGLMSAISSGRWEVQGTRLVYLLNKVSRIDGASKM